MARRDYICCKSCGCKLVQAQQEPAQAVPYGWHVTGLSCLMVGEYAEHDAKAAAKRCGGTTKAIALYTAPPAIDDETREMVLELLTVLDYAMFEFADTEQKVRELKNKIRERIRP